MRTRNPGCGPRRVLFVQSSSGGGSVINLLLAVKNLDPERYVSTVLFFESSSYADEFRAAGARVEVLDSSVKVRSVRKFLPGGAAGKRRRKGLSRTLRLTNRFVQRDWPLARRIADFIRAHEVDLVQSSVCPSADRAIILGAAIARVPQVCYVQYWTSAVRLIDMPLSRHVDRFLCISGAVERQLRRGLPLPDSKISLVYAPFEFAELPSDAERIAIRASLGIARDEILVSNVGRLVRWKGQDVFLRAFSSIAHRYPRARAAVVGGGRPTPEGQAYVDELKHLVSEAGLEDRVLFTGHRTDIEKIMAASDIIVHSSSEPEPLGRVIMEAVSLGIPIIGTDAGGVPEMIRDGETGSLVRIGDVRSMAGALDSLLADPGRATEMAARARREGEQRFAAHTFAKTIQSEYVRIHGD